MAKKLALVVHGIGEQQAGETLDALVGGLTGDRACSVENELRHLRERDRDHPADTDDRDTALFPCHIRRVKRGNDETLFAEAFWGDISRGSTGKVRGLIDLFELVMGLGHIVRENAAEIYRKPTAMPRRAANFFVYLLHGPITAFNIVLVLATALLVFVQWQFGQVEWAGTTAVLVTAVIMMIGWAVAKNPKRSYLYQIHRTWFGLSAVALILIAVLTHAMDLVLSEDQNASAARWLASQCEIADDFSRCFDYWYAAVLSNVLALCWGMCVLIVFGTGAWETIRRFTVNSGTSKALYPQALTLMLTVWMFLIVTLWVAATTSFVSLGLETVNIALVEKVLLPAMNFTVWVSSALAVIALGAVLAWADRKWWTLTVPPADHKQRPIRRLIVHPMILLALTLAIVFIAIGAFQTVAIQLSLATADPIPTTTPVPGDAKLLAYYDTKDTFGVSEKFSTYFTLFAGFLVFSYTYFRSYLAMGIGIAKDIVVYFVRRPAPAITDLRGLNVHPLRTRIQDRLVDTLILLMRSEQPDDIMIVSHSQGTVIALEALRGGRLRAQMQAEGLQPCNIDLVTMGSPTSHLYGFYFTSEFDLKSTDPSKDVTDGINSWVNIYRVDDFVGTDVEGPTETFPINEWVPAKGHTNYWTDDSVLRHLKKHTFPEYLGREI